MPDCQELMSDEADELLKAVRACTLCKDLPLGPRPILQVSPNAKILIVGQAPGRITHHKGIPFDDPSGNRLRDWMGISRDEFYDRNKIALVPMGFCFPGSGKGGDLPPRPECADKWRKPIMEQLGKVQLTLIIGQYAHDWHLPDEPKSTLAAKVSRWREFMPHQLPLPHPSPRNNRWLKLNPWFEEDVLPVLQKHVQKLI